MNLEVGSMVMFRGRPAEVLGGSKLITGGVRVRPLVPFGPHPFDYVTSAESLARGEGSAAAGASRGARHRARPHTVAAPGSSSSGSSSSSSSSSSSESSSESSEESSAESTPHHSRHVAKPHKKHGPHDEKKSHAKASLAGFRAAASLAARLERLERHAAKREARKHRHGDKAKPAHHATSSEDKARICHLVGVTREQVRATAAARGPHLMETTEHDERRARKQARKRAKHLETLAASATSTSAAAGLRQGAERYRRLAAGEAW